MKNLAVLGSTGSIGHITAYSGHHFEINHSFCFSVSVRLFVLNRPQSGLDRASVR